MKRDETRQRLIEATKTLLMSEASPEKITARKIAKKADVNLAMINYCFRSKSALIQQATEELLKEKFEWHLATREMNGPVCERLVRTLTEMTVNVLRCENIVRLSIPYLLLEGPMELPEIISPYLKEYYGDRLSEEEIDILSYTMATSLQTILYRQEEFQNWSGISLKDAEEIGAFIEHFVGLFLN